MASSGLGENVFPKTIVVRNVVLNNTATCSPGVKDYHGLCHVISL